MSKPSRLNVVYTGGLAWNQVAQLATEFPWHSYGSQGEDKAERSEDWILGNNAAP